MRKWKKCILFFASGANMLADRKKLIELGGFNELFSPYYGEDLDSAPSQSNLSKSILESPKS